jgi:hypothetical protein
LTKLFVGPIQPAQEIGDPANIVLGREHLEPGKPLQHAGEENRDQRLLDVHQDPHIQSGGALRQPQHDHGGLSAVDFWILRRLHSWHDPSTCQESDEPPISAVMSASKSDNA